MNRNGKWVNCKYTVNSCQCTRAAHPNCDLLNMVQYLPNYRESTLVSGNIDCMQYLQMTRYNYRKSELKFCKIDLHLGLRWQTEKPDQVGVLYEEVYKAQWRHSFPPISPMILIRRPTSTMWLALWQTRKI